MCRRFAEGELESAWRGRDSIFANGEILKLGVKNHAGKDTYRSNAVRNRIA